MTLRSKITPESVAAAKKHANLFATVATPPVATAPVAARLPRTQAPPTTLTHSTDAAFAAIENAVAARAAATPPSSGWAWIDRLWPVPDGGHPPARPASVARDVVSTIRARASEPWVPLTVGGTEIVTVRPGGMALLIGTTGGGKTSLTLGMLLDHARSRGPAIMMTLELPDDEAVARGIGVQLGAGWANVLRGEISDADMMAALPKRLAVLPRGSDLRDLGHACAALRDAHPNEPILVAVDYAQILPSPEREIRRAVAANVVLLDEIARETRALMLVLSQSSRGNARALRTGELIGADSTDAGAEAADLERWASVTIALGRMGPDREDGSRPVEVSIGKSRMGGGDRVLPAAFVGRTGAWKIEGEAKLAADVKAERTAKNKGEAVAQTMALVFDVLERSDVPLSRNEIESRVGKKAETTRAAIAEHLGRGADSQVVEVSERRRGVHLLWTRSRATRAGVFLTHAMMRSSP